MIKKNKKLLYIAPNHYSFYKVVLNGLREYSDYEVDYFCSNELPKFKYKNVFERLLNVITKNVFSYNIKKERSKKEFIKSIENLGVYDKLFISRPDIFSDNQLKQITSKCKVNIVYYWDSFEKILGQKETLKYFNKKYSFDKNDCKEFGLEKAHNFFYFTEIKNNPKYDLTFLGTLDKRYDRLRKVLLQLEKYNKHINATLYTYHKEDFKENDGINYINKIIPFDEAYTFNQDTQIVVDIHHDNQVGISFRPYEAMGLNKKMITTNSMIKDYDFYNPNNIFVIENEDNFEIPSTFFDTPYQQLPDEIFKKYYIKNWVNTFINN